MTNDGVVSSLDNPQVKAARRLFMRKARKKEGRYLIEGPHLVSEALSAGVGIDTLFHRAGNQGEKEISILLKAASSRGTRIFPVDERVMVSLSDTRSPQGLVGVARLQSPRLEEVLVKRALVVILDEVQDPGNTGAMIRASCALGATGVIVSGGCDPLGPKALRASMGSVFRLPVLHSDKLETCLSFLKGKGLRLVAADPHEGTPCNKAKLTGPLALVMGSEGEGLSPFALSHVDETLTVPMPGDAESLNVTSALAILLYEAYLQRQGELAADSS